MSNIGYGVTLSVSDVAPAVTPINTIGFITDFTPPTITRDIIDSTSSSSPNFAREFIAGLIDFGEASGTMVWNLGTATDLLLRQISLERLPRTYRATFAQYTPARLMTFSGFLVGYEPSAPMAELMTATFTIKCTGTPVVS